MKTEISKHLPHYLSLGGVIVAAIIGFLYFPYDPAFQTAISIALGVSFFVWGIVHHYLHKDLHPKIVLEYLSIGILGIVVLLSVIWRF